jgi:hypothetical protein
LFARASLSARPREGGDPEMQTSHSAVGAAFFLAPSLAGAQSSVVLGFEESG